MRAANSISAIEATLLTGFKLRQTGSAGPLLKDGQSGLYRRLAFHRLLDALSCSEAALLKNQTDSPLETLESRETRALRTSSSLLNLDFTANGIQSGSIDCTKIAIRHSQSLRKQLQSGRRVESKLSRGTGRAVTSTKNNGKRISGCAMCGARSLVINGAHAECT